MLIQPAFLFICRYGGHTTEYGSMPSIALCCECGETSGVLYGVNPNDGTLFELMEGDMQAYTILVKDENHRLIARYTVQASDPIDAQTLGELSLPEYVEDLNEVAYVQIMEGVSVVSAAEVRPRPITLSAYLADIVSNCEREWDFDNMIDLRARGGWK